MITALIIIGVIIWLGCGATTYLIGVNRDRGHYWSAAGLIFGPLGVLVVSACLLPGWVIWPNDYKQSPTETDVMEQYIKEKTSKKKKID